MQTTFPESRITACNDKPVREDGAFAAVYDMPTQPTTTGRRQVDFARLAAILREHGPRYVMEYQGLGAEADTDEGGVPEIPDVAADLARGASAHELGLMDDDLGAVLDELETCRQILAAADSQD